MYSENDFRLYHHGILGMHWGVRNGPPYPLGSGDHSASERKAGWRKSLKKGSSDQNRSSSKATGSSSRSESERYLKKINSKSMAERRKQITPKDRSDYRKEMARRNPKMADFYKNATDQQIDLDIEQKEKLKKALIATAVAVGLTTAVVVAYKTGAVQKIVPALHGIDKYGPQATPALSELAKAAKTNTDLSNNLLTAAAQEAQKLATEDVGLALDKDAVIHRFVAYSDFDLDKAGGAMFAAYKPTDVEAYKIFLGDYLGRSGKWDVSMEVKDKLVAPTKEKTGKIIKEIFDPSTNKGKKLLYQLADDYVEFVAQKAPDMVSNKAKMAKELYESWIDDDSELFDNAIWNLVRTGRVSNKIQGEIRNAGYNMLIDYHDVDAFSQEPIIVLNAARDLRQIGNVKVTAEDKKRGLKYMYAHMDEVAEQFKEHVDEAYKHDWYADYIANI